MTRVFAALFVLILVVSFGSVGCSKAPPEPTGEVYVPPQELDEMKNQMMESYKKGTVNKAE